MDEVKQKELER